MGNWSDAENTAAQEAARQLQERYRTIQQVEQQAPPQAPLPQAPRPQETLGELVARDAGLDRETIQREFRERLRRANGGQTDTNSRNWSDAIQRVMQRKTRDMGRRPTAYELAKFVKCEFGKSNIDGGFTTAEAFECLRHH